MQDENSIRSAESMSFGGNIFVNHHNATSVMASQINSYICKKIHHTLSIPTFANFIGRKEGSPTPKNYLSNQKLKNNIPKPSKTHLCLCSKCIDFSLFCPHFF